MLLVYMDAASSLKRYSLCHADFSLSAAMSGNTWWYWELNEAFQKGGITQLLQVLRLDQIPLLPALMVKQARCGTENCLIKVKWPFLPFEGEPKDWLSQGDCCFTAVCTSYEVFLSSLVIFLSVRSPTVKDSSLLIMTNKTQNPMMSKVATSEYLKWTLITDAELQQAKRTTWLS